MRLRPTDFTAVGLRIATVTDATVEGSVARVAVVHIAENYGPEDLVGTQAGVVAGAEPVVLAAVSPSGGAAVLRPDRSVASGTQVV